MDQPETQSTEPSQETITDNRNKIIKIRAVLGAMIAAGTLVVAGCGNISPSEAHQKYPGVTTTYEMENHNLIPLAGEWLQEHPEVAGLTIESIIAQATPEGDGYEGEAVVKVKLKDGRVLNLFGHTLNDWTEATGIKALDSLGGHTGLQEAQKASETENIALRDALTTGYELASATEDPAVSNGS